MDRVKTNTKQLLKVSKVKKSDMHNPEVKRLLLDYRGPIGTNLKMKFCVVCNKPFLSKIKPISRQVRKSIRSSRAVTCSSKCSKNKKHEKRKNRSGKMYFLSGYPKI